MRRNGRAVRSGLSAITLAGWVFADLLLALSMLFLIASRGDSTSIRRFRDSDGQLEEATTIGTPSLPPTPSVTSTPTSTNTPFPTSTATATATPTSAPSPTLGPALEQERSTYVVMIDAEAALSVDAARREAALVSLREQLAEQIVVSQTRRAGIVLTFGGAMVAGGTRPDQAKRIATLVNEFLRTNQPGMFGDAASEAFHDLSEPLGRVEIWVWFLIADQ